MIVSNCEKAVTINPLNTEAWHYFASTNDEAATFYSKKMNSLYGPKLLKHKKLTGQAESEKGPT